MDRAAGRTRAGDKNHLFIDQTRRDQSITSIIKIIKNPSNPTGSDIPKRHDEVCLQYKGQNARLKALYDTSE
jgi:hypothetical protein